MACKESIVHEALAVRARFREQHSKALVNDIGAMAAGIKAFKGSPLAKALQYLENRWDHLTVFLKDPRVPLTSNAVERSLRGPVLGRKNFLGTKSERGTQVAALFYSLIETCKLNGVDPSRYLGEAARAAIRADSIPLPMDTG